MTTLASKNISAISWSAKKEVPAARATRSNLVPALALGAAIMLGVMLVLHLYWVNSYAAKGFALSAAQNAIKEQTDLQKKLLVQQSLLSSTAGLTDGSYAGLVAITHEEYLAPANYASAN